MKALTFAVCFILLAGTCNDPGVMDPIDDPVDAKLLEFKINGKEII